MGNTYLQIKNMCCARCIEVVGSVLKEIGFHPLSVKVGEVLLAGNLAGSDLHNIDQELQRHGFSIVERNEEKMVIKIHAFLCTYLDKVVNKDGRHKSLSAYLVEMMQRSYYHLSRIFSSTTGITIEKYYLQLKMEKAKELLIQNELTLAEIAWQLGYRSSQTFSTQFKKEIGKTPGEYKEHPEPARIHRDRLLPQHFKQND